MRRNALERAGREPSRYSRDILATRLLAVLLGCFLLSGCGGTAHDATGAAKTPSRDEAVGAEVKRHIEALNPTQDVGIRSISCEERGPVPSMGTNAAAFLCSIYANNGKATKPQLWAYLPQDEENHVELLDETAERELAARGEVAGLNDGHSEADNRSAEQDIHHAEEEVNGSADTTTKRERRVAPPPTTVSTTPQASVPSEQGCGSFLAVGHRFTQVRAAGEFTCPTVRRFLLLLMDQSGHHYRALPDDGVEIGGYACHAATGLADCTSPGGTRVVSAQYSAAAP